MSADRSLRFLFVCTANICRSPLAEAFFNHHAEEAGVGARASSAGTDPGRRMLHPKVIEILADQGIDISPTLSQPVSKKLVDRADVILTMTGHHAISVAAGFRKATTKTFMLDHFVRIVESVEPTADVASWLDEICQIPRTYPNQPGAVGVDDPMGRSDAVFRIVADQIKALTSRMITALPPDGAQA